MKINLGSGNNYLEGYTNLDISPSANPDILIDLEKDLPFESDSVDEILAIDILEHINNLINLMNECYRVLKKGGHIKIVVPQGDNMFGDPTHVRFFSKLSFRYFCNHPLQEIYGIKCKFTQECLDFNQDNDGGKLTCILRK